ncbi:MAG: mechanosensitive ion channel [Rhodothermales bacterium]|nr:mechanosensitive ion channel [Rhodothermales bacterium]MBO6779670.1 mechanosensitive ion channel [Rhodothermales bacterium]
MDFTAALQNELVARLLMLLGVVVVLLLLTRVIIRILTGAVQDPTKAYKASRVVRQIAAVVGVAAALVILSPDSSGLVTILTVIGAGLAISLRETLLSVVGWLRLVTMNDYRVGDRIEIGGTVGDVIDIRLFRTTLMEIRGWVDADQSSGRITHVPNAWVWQHAVHNYNRGFSFIWHEISLTVTHRSDWRAAREIMLSLAQESATIVEQQAGAEIREMSREFLVHYGILTPFVYVRITRDGILLTLRYLTEVRKRRGTEHALTISILDAFRERGGIEFAHGSMDMWPPDAPRFGEVPDKA